MQTPYHILCPPFEQHLHAIHTLQASVTEVISSCIYMSAVDHPVQSIIDLTHLLS